MVGATSVAKKTGKLFTLLRTMFFQTRMVLCQMVTARTFQVFDRIMTDLKMIGTKRKGQEHARVDTRITIKAFKEIFSILARTVQFKEGKAAGFAIANHGMTMNFLGTIAGKSSNLYWNLTRFQTKGTTLHFHTERTCV